MTHDQDHRTSTPSRNVTVNGKKIPIWRHIMNPMIPEACIKHGVDFVDNHIIHTYIKDIHLPFAQPQANSFIYYFPDRIDLEQPLVAIVGLRIKNPLLSRTIVDAIHYEEDFCHILYTFLLPGDIGCKATANLGFLLLNELTGVMPDGISMLTIVDMSYLQQNQDDNSTPVTDEAIQDFCSQRGVCRV